MEKKEKCIYCGKKAEYIQVPEPWLKKYKNYIKIRNFCKKCYNESKTEMRNQK